MIRREHQALTIFVLIGRILSKAQHGEFDSIDLMHWSFKTWALPFGCVPEVTEMQMDETRPRDSLMKGKMDLDQQL